MRVEQAQAIGFTTLDTFLKIDDGNRSFFRTNAPVIHEFAEYLRVKTPDGDRRWVSYLKSLDNIKLAYKSGAASSNQLVTALAVLESTVTEAQKQLTAATLWQH